MADWYKRVCQSAPRGKNAQASDCTRVYFLIFLKWIFKSFRSKFHGLFCTCCCEVLPWGAYLPLMWRTNLSASTFRTLCSIPHRLPPWRCKVQFFYFTAFFFFLNVYPTLNMTAIPQFCCTRHGQWQWKDWRIFKSVTKKNDPKSTALFFLHSECIYIEKTTTLSPTLPILLFQSALETYIFFVLTTPALVWPANAAATVPVRHGEHAR